MPTGEGRMDRELILKASRLDTGYTVEVWKMPDEQVIPEGVMHQVLLRDSETDAVEAVYYSADKGFALREAWRVLDNTTRRKREQKE